MRGRFQSLVWCWLIVPGLCGCTQTPWAKPANPFSSNSLGLSGAATNAPQNPLALARLTESQGRNEQAEAMYLDAIKKSPNDPVPEHRLGVVYAKMGRFADAGQHFGRALSLAPNNCELLNDAGYFYYLAGNQPEAERCLRRALQLQPEDARTCTNLALLLGEMRRDEECLTLFRRAAPTGNQAYLNFAYVLAQRGDYSRAMDAYDRVLTEDPSRRVAADAMVELSKYSPRKTTLPRPAFPSVTPAQVAANAAAEPVANTPAGTPMTPPSGIPQNMAAAMPAMPAAPGTGMPAYPTTVATAPSFAGMPAYPTMPAGPQSYPTTTAYPTTAAYPTTPNYPNTANYPTTTPATTAARPVGYWQ